MSWIPDRYREFRALVGGVKPERDVSDELAHHLAMRVAENVARGMAPDAARAEALARLGNVGAYEREAEAIDVVAARGRRRIEVRDALGRETRLGCAGCGGRRLLRSSCSPRWPWASAPRPRSSHSCMPWFCARCRIRTRAGWCGSRARSQARRRGHGACRRPATGTIARTPTRSMR